MLLLRVNYLMNLANSQQLYSSIFERNVKSAELDTSGLLAVAVELHANLFCCSHRCHLINFNRNTQVVVTTNDNRQIMLHSQALS